MVVHVVGSAGISYTLIPTGVSAVDNRLDLRRVCSRLSKLIHKGGWNQGSDEVAFLSRVSKREPVFNSRSVGFPWSENFSTDRGPLGA